MEVYAGKKVEIFIFYIALFTEKKKSKYGVWDIAKICSKLRYIQF